MRRHGGHDAERTLRGPARAYGASGRSRSAAEDVEFLVGKQTELIGQASPKPDLPHRRVRHRQHLYTVVVFGQYAWGL